MTTVNDYIKGIKTMGDVMNLAKMLKKMDLEMSLVESLVANARVQLMEVNREEYDRYVNYVGFKSQIDPSYGCMKHELNCNHGGRVIISDWTASGETTSLATIHISNGWGMGFSNYINNQKDVQKEIQSVKQITWINEEERQFLINALTNLVKK